MAATSAQRRRDIALDLACRSAYRLAYTAQRVYWSLRHPHTHGALVAVWHRGSLLVVKSSYRREYTLPGGYIRRGESAAQAGRRELGEEVGVHVPLAHLQLAYQGTKLYESRHDNVTILEVSLEQRPVLAIDNREVVWAGFEPPAAVMEMPIVPHLREWLESRRVAQPGCGGLSAPC